MYMLKDLIDMVEVGMRIGLSNRENGCYFGGTVTKKLLYHDSETHKEEHHLEVDVDGVKKEITNIEKYSVYALINRECKDLLRINQEDIRAYYFPDAYADPVDAFFEMLEDWNRSGDYEREVMATVMMERMNADVLEEIMGKVNGKFNAVKLAGDILAMVVKNDAIEDEDIEDEDIDEEEDECI